MFAIAYDIEVDALKKHYHPTNYPNAYAEIRKFMEARGFSKKQGSVLYGDETVTMVSAVIAVADLSRQLPWLGPCLTDIRILRILDQDDLMPAIQSGASTTVSVPS
jgi:virulence-associated protein VapD